MASAADYIFGITHNTTTKMKQFFYALAISATIILTSSCESGKIKIACVGDSITEGYGLACQSKNSYPVVLGQLLGSDYIVQNCGRSATTLQKQGDFPYWICKEFSNTFALEPDIIVIKLGTNDTKPHNWNAKRFTADYQALIDTFLTIPSNPQIFVCTPAPVVAPQWGINDSTIVSSIIPILDSIARVNHLPIIDIHSGLANQLYNITDSVHPNEAGVATMAQIVATAINKHKN